MTEIEPQHSCFVDSNIWLYRLLNNQSLSVDEQYRKRRIAISLTSLPNLIVSTQVINEVCTNAIRKAGLTEAQIKNLVQSFEIGVLSFLWILPH